MFQGVLDLPWWGYVVVVLATTHITIAAVTIFLHRHQAHRALDLHPIAGHFFRFWLWFTTGMVTKEWAAIHRKHHAKCETRDDPHSPQIHGIRKLLLEGTELYRAESKNAETMERYGHGTPDDWIERRLYTKHSAAGVTILLLTELALFGPIGATMWAVQMLWIPILAAGVINGVGHYWGYRNFQSVDASKNILPWGILIGGEELHNNHHAYATSAKLSNKWYEFDIGWLYIRVLSALGLAQVKKIAPRVKKLAAAKPSCDDALLQAVITHRYDVLQRYAAALKGTWRAELRSLRARAAHGAEEWHKLKGWLTRDSNDLPEPQRARLSETVQSSRVLTTVHSMREELTQIWGRSTASRDQLVRQLDDWCKRAEASGIQALEQFSHRLRCYA
ncbi:MAG: DesA family fatty acid desaturase [Burkholderiales bacterium]